MTAIAAHPLKKPKGGGSGDGREGGGKVSTNNPELTEPPLNWKIAVPVAAAFGVLLLLVCLYAPYCRGKE